MTHSPTSTSSLLDASAVQDSTPAGFAAEAFAERTAAVESGDIRRHAARGTIVNAIFQVSISSLALLKGFVVAAFLTQGDYGIWTILVIALGTLLWLKNIGIADKYVQQDERDQELAYQKAFTLDLMLNLAFMVALLALVPLVALAYGDSRIVAPGLVAALALPALAFQSPQWVFYRQLNYKRQRLIGSADPISGFVITVALAILGFGYWSLVLGAVLSTYVGAAVCVRYSPYRLRLRFDRATLRSYVDFSWPLLITGASALVIPQVSTLVGARTLGVAAVGVIGLASSVSLYAHSVDDILSQTLYPAICAVKDRTELLFETFVKSNRLTLMWGVPFGIGLTLFAADLTHFVLPHWKSATGTLAAFGAIAAAYHVAFNWDSYFRARGETKPIAVVAVATMIAFCALAIPGMLIWGLPGFSAGMALATLVNLAGRAFYLSRLFPGFGILRHTLRASIPTIPAALVVLGVRALENVHSRNASLAAGELCLYIAVAIGATLLVERALLLEMVGYLRRGSVRPRLAL